MEQQIILHDLNEVLNLIPDFKEGKILFSQKHFYQVIYTGKYGFTSEIYSKNPLKHIKSLSMVYCDFFDNKMLKELNIKVKKNEPRNDVKL